MTAPYPWFARGSSVSDILREALYHLVIGLPCFLVRDPIGQALLGVLLTVWCHSRGMLGDWGEEVTTVVLVAVVFGRALTGLLQRADRLRFGPIEIEDLPDPPASGDGHPRHGGRSSM